MKHFVRRKTQMNLLGPINGKSVSLARIVTRTLAVVTSCCRPTNNV